ncbi:hypothetical protein T484DRAFT_1777472 [Baffinella frigidus]|nr:hypothetical protein T484DRAFT_1777472 [Cryptophyta sp. CCMP2293]
MSDSNEDETYECPLCFVPIAGSIMQCKNGHISCEGCHRDCKEKFQGKCPTCNIPLDDIRNRALEEMRDRLAKKEAKRSAPKNKDAEPKKKAAKHSHEASPASPLPGTAKDRPLEEEEAKSLLPGLHAWQDEREAASKVDRMIEERSIDIKTYFQLHVTAV